MYVYEKWHWIHADSFYEHATLNIRNYKQTRLNISTILINQYKYNLMYVRYHIKNDVWMTLDD